MSEICRLAATRWYCWLLLTFLVGCQSGGHTGPIYKLHVPEERPLVAPVAVSVTDARPADEKKYRAGAVQPADYKNGVERLALENFEPHVTDLIKQTLTQRLSELPKAPVWADVEVTGFRTTIDRREMLAAEYERELRAEQMGSAIDVGVGLGGGGGIASGLMAAAAASSSLRELEADRSSWDHAMSGVNCRIDVKVQLHWENDHRETFELSAESHWMASADEESLDHADGMKWNIGPTVEKAISQIGEDLHGRALEVSKTLVPERPRVVPLEELPPALHSAWEESVGESDEPSALLGETAVKPTPKEKAGGTKL